MAYDVKVRAKVRMVKAGTLLANPNNWRQHPEAQRRALTAALEEIGIVAPLVAREVDGQLELIDGHLRADLDPEQEMPVAVVDLTDEEARKAILVLDPIGAMAEADEVLRRELLASTDGINEGFEEYLASERRAASASVPTPGEPSEPNLRDEYLVTVTVPAELFEEFQKAIDPWRVRDGITVDISSPG